MASTKKEIRKNAKKRAKEVLAINGNRAKLAGAVVLCISLTMIMWLLSGLTDIVLDIFDLNYEYLYYPVSMFALIIMMLYLVAPVYVGTYRMAVHMLDGEQMEVADIFEPFSSVRKYRRALRSSFKIFRRIAPILIALNIHAIMDYLSYWFVFYEETIKNVDYFFIPAAFILVFWANRPFGMVSFAYFDEGMKLRHARKMARKARKGYRSCVLGVSLGTLIKLLLSMLTLGIATIVHVIPLSMLTYGAMAEELKRRYEADMK